MARGKNTRKFTVLFFIAFIGFIIFDNFDLFDIPAEPEKQQQAVEPAAYNSASYAMQTSVNNWPRISEANASYAETADLLASSYYLVLDASGSMNNIKCSGDKSKMDVAFNALDDFIQSLPEKTNFGLAIFHNSKLQELAPLGQQIDRKNIVFSIRHKIQPNGSTPLARAMQFAYQKINDHASRQLGYGEHHLVLITDGLADDGQNPDKIISRITRESPIVINIIGFCLDNSNALKQPGITLYYSANDPESLKQGLQAVLAEAPEFDVSGFSE